MRRKLFALTAMGALALLLSGPGNQAEAGFFSKLFGHSQSNSCCEPVCCAPAPTCCAPIPTCCAPVPTCCAPVPTCSGDEAPPPNGSEAAPAPAPPADAPPEPESEA